MPATELTTMVEGRYFWELLFSYDNSNNNGEIVDKTTIIKRKTVNAKEFLSNKFNIAIGFKYNKQTSFSLKLAKVKAGDASNLTFHTDLAYELVKTSETAETIEEETKTERSYTVAGGGKLDMYRLCYASDGGTITSDIVSTAPRSDILVELEFICTKSLLGLSDMLKLLLETRPKSSNKREWEKIRGSIIQHSDKGQEDAFEELVKVLHNTKPENDNKKEWEAIRGTCGEILAGWDTTDKQLLFKKLLARFSTTKPQIDNKVEWERIRNLSDQIREGVVQIF